MVNFLFSSPNVKRVFGVGDGQVLVVILMAVVLVLAEWCCWCCDGGATTTTTSRSLFYDFFFTPASKFWHLHRMWSLIPFMTPYNCYVPSNSISTVVGSLIQYPYFTPTQPNHPLKHSNWIWSYGVGAGVDIRHKNFLASEFKIHCLWIWKLWESQ